VKSSRIRRLQAVYAYKAVLLGGWLGPISENKKKLIPGKGREMFPAVPPLLTDTIMVELVGFEPTTS
jgi:hypothetical protein